MPILSMYDQILTPRGYRYPFTLRPGSPVWTKTDLGYATVPFKYQPLDESVDAEDWIDFSLTQHWQRRWYDPDAGRRITVPNGSSGHPARTHRRSRVLTPGGPKRAMMLRAGERLHTVPVNALADSITHDQYLRPRLARERLLNNANHALTRAPPALSVVGERPQSWPRDVPDGPLTVSRRVTSASISKKPKHMTLLHVDHGVIHNGLVLS